MLGSVKETLLCLLIFTSVAFSRQLMEGECSKPSDCGPGECCVLGPERYAIPECREYATIDKHCHEGAEPQNRLLYYPNDELRWVEDMYIWTCPCETRLICRKSKCSKP